MKVALGWLKEYVDFDLSPEELVHRLDMSGTKVEAVHRPSDDVEGVIVAEVEAIEPHPNADSLSLVTVDTDPGGGGTATQRVVCGASNFAVGDRVPLARVGARLPGVTITERKIRGEVSRGMLCSGAELGISKDHSGILVLQPDAPIGHDVVKLLNLGDTILELEITPNRPDCMSMIGIAREVGALAGTELRIPETGLETDDLDSPVEVTIEDPTGCSRYLARYLEGVKVGPSPAWMAARLLAAGFRPISNIVDVTNYVLLETGQPLHAFDAAKVHRRAIHVRRARAGEKLTTLDGIERELDTHDLVIADPERALALAGVMGGLDSEVSDETSTVLLESAAFDKVSVSFTGRRHGLRSEASARFERGSDPEAVPYAAARAAGFMKETAGGRVAQSDADRYPGTKERPVVRLRPARTGALLGLTIPAERQAEHLRSVGLSVAEGEGVLDATVPSWRPDLEREADLIEEVARLEGFESLPSTIPGGPEGGLDRAQTTERTLRRVLVALGLTEAWTSSFMSPTELDALGLDAEHPARRMVELANPMLESEPALRTTLLPGLLRSVARNTATHRPSGVALFEIARVYQPAPELADERPMVAAVMTGDESPASWAGPAQPWDFFAAKGVLERSLATLGIRGIGFEPLGGAPFHPTRGAWVLLPDRSVLGVLGELHPGVCERFEVPPGTVAWEIGFDPLVASLPSRAVAAEIARFPGNYIDLALVVDEAVPAATLLRLIEEAGAPEVTSVRLFDLYTGEQIPDGKKSLAFALELSVPEGTVTDERARAVSERILGALRERTGAQLRE